MKTYNLIHVKYSSTVQVLATDTQIIEQLHDALVEILQKEIPGFQIEMSIRIPGMKTDRFLDHKPHEIHLSKLSGGDWKVFIWIVQWLCERGWQPFDVNTLFTSDANAKFRLEVDD